MKKYDPNDNGHLIAQVKDRLRNNHNVVVEMNPSHSLYETCESITFYQVGIGIKEMARKKRHFLGKASLGRSPNSIIRALAFLTDCEESLKAGNGLPMLFMGTLDSPANDLPDSDVKVYH